MTTASPSSSAGSKTWSGSSPPLIRLTTVGPRNGWCDIDFDNDTITVRHQLYRGVFKDSAKTPAGDDRLIPVLPFLRGELLIALEVAGAEGLGTEFVLVDEYGESLSADQILKQGIYKTAATKATTGSPRTCCGTGSCRR